MLAEYNSVSRNRKELERRVEEWLQDVQKRRINDVKQAKLQTSRLSDQGRSIASQKFECLNMQQNISPATPTRSLNNEHYRIEKN